MKRIISIIILIATLTIALSACGMGKVKIEDYEWKMRTIMHGEDNQVVVDAVGEDDPAHPEAKIIDMTLTANVGYSWGIIRVGSLLPTRFSFPHAILMRFNLRRIAAN